MANWKQCWEKAIQKEIAYIISKLKLEMKFAEYGKGDEVLLIIPDERFFRKDILDRLSGHPELVKLGCYAKPLFEYEIAIIKK